MMKDLRQLRQLLQGLAAGDSLGGTSEFVSPHTVAERCLKAIEKGWPLKQVGGGTFNWKPGEPTDDTDMAMCMVRSFCEADGEFDPADIALRFVNWQNSGPRDIGGTTARTLSKVWQSEGQKMEQWWVGGEDAYRRSPTNAANGSLMRNGVIVGMAHSLAEAYLYTVQHSIITHFAPLPVLCCAMQTWLLWCLLEDKRWPFERPDWFDQFRASWTRWRDDERDGAVIHWDHTVSNNMDEAWATLEAADWCPYTFNPFGITSGRGYCLTTLQVGVWALCWSIEDEEDFDTDILPEATRAVFAEVHPATADTHLEGLFDARLHYPLAWVALVGNDSDTYGATAGPLIAAAHGEFPAGMVEGLTAVEEFDGYVEETDDNAEPNAD